MAGQGDDYWTPMDPESEDCSWLEFFSHSGYDVTVPMVGNHPQGLLELSGVQNVWINHTRNAEFLEDAIQGGAEAFISSDFKHHQFLQADGRIMVLDIGHFESEQFIKDIYRDLLKDAPIQLRFATTDLSPVKAYV
jgi:putative NIF3 family GTP cyclohydrolase 1 type 2